MTAPRPKNRRAVSPRERTAPRFEHRTRPARLSEANPEATEAAPDVIPQSPPDVQTISRASRRGLDAFAFFVANLQTGFGPFLAVYFTQAKWTQSDIGFALTVGSLVSLLGQVPGGAFVDAVRSKRFAAGVAVAAISG